MEPPTSNNGRKQTPAQAYALSVSVRIAIGVALGVALHNIGIGVAVGIAVAIALCLSTCLHQEIIAEGTQPQPAGVGVEPVGDDLWRKAA